MMCPVTGYAYLDTETTGFRLDDHVLQVAVVLMDADYQITNVWDSYVNWGLRYLPGYQVHRITPQMVAGAPGFARVADKVTDLIGDRTVVAHHLDFDRRLLNANAERAGHPLRITDGICTVELARELLPRPHHNRLGDLCRRFSIPLGNAHNARFDAIAGAKVLGQLAAIRDRRALETATEPEPAVHLPMQDWLARLTA